MNKNLREFREVRFQIKDVYEIFKNILGVSLSEISVEEFEFNAYQINPDYKKYVGSTDQMSFVLFVEDNPVRVHIKMFYEYIDSPGIKYFAESTNKMDLVTDLTDIKNREQINESITIKENISINCKESRIILDKGEKIKLVK